MNYDLIVKRCEAVGLTPFCPRCCTEFLHSLRSVEVGWLHPNRALNPLSRRSNQYVCRACGAAEGLADRTEGLTDGMARTVVEQDRQEAMRLAPGGFWSVALWPTGGFEQWAADLNARYVKLCREVDARVVMASGAIEPGATLRVNGCSVEIGFHVVDLDADPDTFWEEMHRASRPRIEAPDPDVGQDRDDPGPIPADR